MTVDLKSKEKKVQVKRKWEKVRVREKVRKREREWKVKERISINNERDNGIMNKRDKDREGKQKRGKRQC